MDRKSDKRISKRVLTSVLAVLLMAIVVFSFTACSLFTDAIKGVFSGQNSAETSEGGGTTPGTSIVTPTDEPEDSGIVTVDPPIEVSSNVVEITSSLTYDKASTTDLTIEATHANKDYNKVMGIGLVNNGDNATVRTLLQVTGSSRVQFDGNYLSSLDAGYYYFYYCVSDSSDQLYYEPFRLEITNSTAAPTDLKINYDVDCPSVYVCFHCDCGGAHTVAFDGTSYPAVAGATQVKVTATVDKAASHTATVTCAEGEHRSATVTKAAPEFGAISNGYIDFKYSFMGHKADGYIEDDKESADIFQYLIYAGEGEQSFSGYLAPSVQEKLSTQDKINAYLGAMQKMITVPWSVGFGISVSGKVATFTVSFGETSVLSSGYEDNYTYENNGKSSHHPELNARNKVTDSLPIDSKKEVSARNVKELLAVVEKGYKPVVMDETLAVYNKARDFCYTYLSDEMTAMQKLHVIYDYLAGEISYDHSALSLYMLIADIVGQGMSLPTAKATINLALDDDSNGFSVSMKSAIIAARDSAASTDDLIDKLRNKYLQRLSAFSVEGVFNDKVAVCEGISYAFMLLARIEGIECYQITGDAVQGSSQVAHAWNKVHLDGAWYCVDATWGNIHFDDKTYVTHRYFMVDDAILAKDHKEKISGMASVKDLAIGEFDYYKSVTTSSTYTLYVANDSALRAAIAYYCAGADGSDYFEIVLAPTYRPTTSDFTQAYLATGHTCSGLVRDSEGRVCLGYFNRIL